MLYLFISLVFISFVQNISAIDDECDPRALCGCSRRPLLKGKVINGDPAFNYTWAISIRNETNHHFCGGSILNEWYVITAAHCFDHQKNLSKITICAGTKRLSEVCRQHRELYNITIHSSYIRGDKFENDIALIQVKESFNFSDISIARICLPKVTHNKEYPKSGTNVTAIGWGTDKRGQVPDALQQVTIKVLNESEDHCDDESVHYNHNIKLCASAPGKDTCDGDSGGPLMMFTNSRRWELIGITSYGHLSGCATKYPGVYTRVTAFLTWVQQIIDSSSSQCSNSNICIITWPNGDHYEGQLKDDMMHGRGTFNYASGKTYIGEWVKGKRMGSGEFIWPDNSRYKGHFKDGKMHGIGTYSFTSGHEYKGNWVEGKRTGHGSYTWPDNVRYEGEFKNGKLHGVGKMIYADGKITNGTWLNNRFVG